MKNLLTKVSKAASSIVATMVAHHLRIRLIGARDKFTNVVYGRV